ncbi:unnamed protein product, partial [Closterium sp. NIES-64]
VTVFTAYGASATSLIATLPDGGSSAASAASAKPLLYKGKTFIKYVAKMKPTKRNGKIVGDKGASGIASVKVVRYSDSSYRITYYLLLKKLKGGGSPWFGFAPNCFAASLDEPAWFNLTNPKSGRKRYSFMFVDDITAGSEGSARSIVNDIVRSSYAVAGQEGNDFALCGK